MLNKSRVKEKKWQMKTWRELRSSQASAFLKVFKTPFIIIDAVLLDVFLASSKSYSNEVKSLDSDQVGTFWASKRDEH